MGRLMSNVFVLVSFRLDILLTANNTIGNYWISVQSQFRSDPAAHL